jgi:hypothetical protein
MTHRVDEFLQKDHMSNILILLFIYKVVQNMIKNKHFLFKLSFKSIRRKEQIILESFSNIKC